MVHFGGYRHFGFLQSAISRVCRPSLGDVGWLQKLRKLRNHDTQAAKIMKPIWLGTNLGVLT